jgi:hypothetical protein
MSELGAEKSVLPVKKQRGHFVQTDRAAHEAWGRLAVKSPAAGALLHVLVANVGEQNAIVASHKILAKLMGSSPATVKRALKILEFGNWIEVVQVGASGTVNAYVLNSRVAWAEGRDRIRYSRLQAEVLVSEEEQPKNALDSTKDELYRLPRLGELQLPSGQGLPPISQPSFPGLEPDLPATRRDEGGGQ